MLLILSNFYDEDMPSWPEVIGVYGINLPKRGHKIHWIMPYKTKIFHKIKKECYNNVGIYLIPFTSSDSRVLKAFSMALYQLRLLIFILESIGKERYNIIQIRDDAIAGIIGVFVKFIFKIPVTFNYSFPFYQGVYEEYKNGFKNFPTLLYWKLMDIILIKIVLKHSNFIFPISIEMAKELERRGIKGKKMFPLPLGIEPKIFESKLSKESAIRKKYCLKGSDFLYIYVGTIAKIRELKTVVKAFKKIVEVNPNAKLLLVGDGDDLQNLKEGVRNWRIDDNVIFTGRAPYWDVPSYIGIADVGLSLIYPRKCYYVSSPCKLFEYMALKKPIIANKEIPEHERVIRDGGNGLLTNYDEDEIADAMLWMMDHREHLNQMGNKGYKWVMKNRTFGEIAEKLEGIYTNLLQKRDEHG